MTEVLIHTAMQEMTFWQVILNSPEWVGVLANILFATVTIGVVIWQVRVMKRQNSIIRLQHEHEWLLRLNAEREQILKLCRKLHLAIGGIALKEKKTDALRWEQTQDTAFELNARLNTMDSSAYTDENGNWFPRLQAYVDSVLKVVGEDYQFKNTYALDDAIPSESTRKALRDSENKHNPITISLALESAIRMAFFDFNAKWDSSFSTWVVYRAAKDVLVLYTDKVTELVNAGNHLSHFEN